MLTKLYSWLAALVGGLVLFASVFFAGKKQEKERAEAVRKLEKAEAEKAVAERKTQVLETKEGIRNEVSSLPAGGAADRLRDKWSRD